MTERPMASSSESVATGASGTAIEALGLTKSYRATRRGHAGVALALNALTLTVPVGQWLAVLGPNGSGKSTFLKLVSGVVGSDSGTLTSLGVAITGAHSARDRRYFQRLGVVFQTPGLDALLTIRENLRTQAALFAIGPSTLETRVEQLAASLGIAARLDDRVGSLSGGLVRRADLARALLSEPSLLLLDEATTGLDPAARSDFLSLVAALRASREVGRALTIVMTTHLLDEAERADRVVLFDEGRVVADGTPSELKGKLGPRVLRIGWSTTEEAVRARAVLSEIGLASSSASDGSMTTPITDAGVLERAVVGLARAWLKFEVSEPSLEDVYRAATGRGLVSHEESPPVPLALQRRRR